MRLPQLEVPATSRMVTEVFYGYNHNPRIQQGEMWDETNITLDSYPALSQRPRRSVRATLSNAQGLTAKESLCWVDGATLYINGDAVTGLELSTEEADCPKQLVSMGAYLVIFPDGKYVNTQNYRADYGSINARRDSEGNDVTYYLCAAIGEKLDTATIPRQSTPPSEPLNGDYWIDTSVSPQNLKQYSSYSMSWTIVPTTYVRLESPNIGAGFSAGDGVNLSGIAYSETGDNELLRSELAALNGDNIIQDCGEGYITITGLISQTYTQEEGTVAVKRQAPRMEYVVESGNRLWGCHYGLTDDGQMVNEIYASKLGDFKNWRAYAGNATDSYAVGVGSDGPWTGAISYRNYPYFFKEDCVHQVYGAYPAAYQVVYDQIPGVQRHCASSLVKEGGYLYYRSPMGVCQYDGSQARYISQALGNVSYVKAAAGTFRGRVYMSMQRTGGEWDMLVYDSEKGMWCREDDTQARFFAATEYDLYYIDAGGNLVSVMGLEGEAEAPVEWEIVSGPIGFEYPDRKYLSRFVLRMGLGPESTARLYIEYDSGGEWELQGTEMAGKGIKSFTLPVRPKRCDHLRWKLKGQGEMKLYSVAKIYEAGSDVT